MMVDERIGDGGNNQYNGAAAAAPAAEGGGAGGEKEDEEVMYKTKVIQFLGRSTPIVLQNDNGPCPLLAICNVLLLRNSLNLSVDASEVSLQKLLSLVAEKLIDSNSSTQDKDDGYMINQQQNIADAIDLLPRLATGIDVNVQFRKINDFEFTRECAIFDLLDIGIYHGWIVDPQDKETASAIGSQSYNTLVAELVAFEASKCAEEDMNIIEEDSVDFSAATTAVLGVPSPCLSRGRSFDDPPIPIQVEEGSRKGDREEVEELMRALNLSKFVTSSPLNVSNSPDTNSSHILEGSGQIGYSGSGNLLNTAATQTRIEADDSQLMDLFAPQKCNVSIDYKDDGLNSNASLTENDVLFTNNNIALKFDHPVSGHSADFLTASSPIEGVKTDLSMQNEAPLAQSTGIEGSEGCHTLEDLSVAFKEEPAASPSFTGDFVMSNKPADSSVEYNTMVFSAQDTQYADFHSSNGRGDLQESSDVCYKGLTAVSEDETAASQTCSSDAMSNMHADDLAVFSVQTVENVDFPSSNGKRELPDVSEVGSSSLDDSEPIYEGEECILDSGPSKYDDQEPVYEGEVVLAQQADNAQGDACTNSKDKVSLQQCRLIRNFLENTASQLTVYGLFCLQDGLKERELCVFFRNNHFSTMFKFNGELYILATDQGYINQPDLVWEKLNEVNGDTVFMTGNFTEFKIENQVSESWNEQNVMTSTADYLATLEASGPASSTLNSDLQLAIALQQQEFGQQSQQSQQQPQRSSQQSSQQPAVSGRSRLFTGPQVSRSPQATQKSETKKEKCIVM